MPDQPAQQEIQPGTQEEPDSAGQPEGFGEVEDAAHQIARLEAYLNENFPAEVSAPPGHPDPETSVDVAMRLLTKLSAVAHPSQITRCDERFCNKPSGHTDEHGWVNVS